MLTTTSSANAVPSSSSSSLHRSIQPRLTQCCRASFSSSTFSSFIASLSLLSVLIQRKRERGLKGENFLMNLSRGFLLRAVLFVLLAGSSAAAPFIFGDVLLGLGSTTGRNLLQETQNCQINFEYMDYKIITSKCKGPQYAAKSCCSALKEFACPYVEQLNDLTNDCASTMFSYINLHGKYPPGLFSSECREGKEGLDCRVYISKSDNVTAISSAHLNQSLFPLVGAVYGLIMALILR